MRSRTSSFSRYSHASLRSPRHVGVPQLLPRTESFFKGRNCGCRPKSMLTFLSFHTWTACTVWRKSRMSAPPYLVTGQIQPWIDVCFFPRSSIINVDSKIWASVLAQRLEVPSIKKSWRHFKLSPPFFLLRIIILSPELSSVKRKLVPSFIWSVSSSRTTSSRLFVSVWFLRDSLLWSCKILLVVNCSV